MIQAHLRNLAVLSVTDPAEAARQILSQYPSRDVMWIAFGLAVVLNTFVQTGSSLLYPLVAPELQTLYDPVWWTLCVSAGALMLNIVAFYFVGRLFGGVGSFDGIMALMIWLKFLQIIAQSIIFVLVMIVPALLTPLVLGVALLSLYITLHFLNQVHHFQSIGKSFLVVLIYGAAMVPIVLLLFPYG